MKNGLVQLIRMGKSINQMSFNSQSYNKTKYVTIVEGVFFANYNDTRETAQNETCLVRTWMEESFSCIPDRNFREPDRG